MKKETLISCGVTKTHLYIDAAVRLHDLRGRNFVNNLVQLAFAECVRWILDEAEIVRVGGGTARVVTWAKLPNARGLRRFLALLNAFNLPAIMSARIGDEAILFDYVSAERVRLGVEVWPNAFKRSTGGRCSICQTPLVITAERNSGDQVEFFRHVVGSEYLCPACLAARFAGRVLNNACVVDLHGVMKGVSAGDLYSVVKQAAEEMGIVLRFSSKDDANCTFFFTRHAIDRPGDLAGFFFTLRVGGDIVTYVNVLVGLSSEKSVEALRRCFRSVGARLAGLLGDVLKVPLERSTLEAEDVLGAVYRSFTEVSLILLRVLRWVLGSTKDRLGGVLPLKELGLRVDYGEISHRGAYKGIDEGRLVVNPLFTSLNIKGWSPVVDLDLLYAYSPGTGIAVIRSDGDRFGTVGTVKGLIKVLGSKDFLREDAAEAWERILEEVLLKYFKSTMPLLMSVLVPSINVYYGGDENLLIVPARLGYVRDIVYAVRNSLLAVIVRAAEKLGSQGYVALSRGNMIERLVAARSGTLSTAAVMSVRKFPMYYLVSFANHAVEAVKAVRDATLMVYVVSVSQPWPIYDAWFRDAFRVPIPNEILDAFVRLCERTSGEPAIHRAYYILNALSVACNEPVDSEQLEPLRSELIEALSNSLRGMDEVMCALRHLEERLCGVTGLPALDTIRSVHKGVE